MSCSPEQAKDFSLELQGNVANLLKKKYPSWGMEHCLDIANEIVEYAFTLMLKTHTGEKLRTLTDDDIPF